MIKFAVMKKILAMATALFAFAAYAQERELIWSDEFDSDGQLSEKYWNYENGLERRCPEDIS